LALMARAAAALPLFSLRLVVGLVAAGIVGFVAFLWLAAYAGDFRTGRDGRAHALSIGATGFKGLVALVGSSGRSARLIRSELDLDTDDLVVVAIDEQFDSKALPRLMELRSAKPTLLILPKWQTIPSERRSGWVYSAGLLPPDYVASRLKDVAEPEVRQDLKNGGIATGWDWLAHVRAPLRRHFQTLSGAGLAPLISAPGGGALLLQIGEQPHYLLADPDLMNNQGLKDPRTARAALQILDALNSTGAGTISFDLTANGFGRTRSVLRLAFEPPFIVLTLALLTAALLAGLHGAFRFGPEKREERAIALGKAALVENSAGLVRLVRREHRLGGAYAELIADDAARISGAPPALNGADLHAYLDRLSAPGARTFSELAARAESAASRDDLLHAARALFLWKKELIQ
jgi:hypothetical protein